MWCWIILVVRLVILLTLPNELSSQRSPDCGHHECGYNAVCSYDTDWRPTKCICTNPPVSQGNTTLAVCNNTCDGVTCGANKTCATSGNQHTRQCVCSPRYLPHGERCVDKCGEVTCGANETCTTSGNQHTRQCVCAPRFLPQGERCVAGCEINPCVHPMQVCRVRPKAVPLCTCKNDHFWENGTCWKTCKGPSDCSENSTCLGILEHVHVCVCKPGYNRTLTGQCVGGRHVGIIVVAAIAGVVIIFVVCVVIYAFIRYRVGRKRLGESSEVATPRDTSVDGARPGRGLTPIGNVDIRVNTEVIIGNSERACAGQPPKPPRVPHPKLQEKTSDYDLDTLYSNGKIPEQKRLAMESKLREENHSEFDDYLVPRYHTLNTSVTNAENNAFSATATSAGNVESQTQLDYDHIRLHALR